MSDDPCDGCGTEDVPLEEFDGDGRYCIFCQNFVRLKDVHSRNLAALGHILLKAIEEMPKKVLDQPIRAGTGATPAPAGSGSGGIFG